MNQARIHSSKQSPKGLMRLISPISPLRLMALIGLMALVGCSQSDDLPSEETQETVISFQSELSDQQSVTRATPLELTYTTFKVWAYKNDGSAPAASPSEPTNYTSYQTVMPGFTVNWGSGTAYTSTSNTHDWEYVGQAADQTIKYWDFNAQAYRFFAVAGTAGSYTATPPATSSDPYEVALEVDATDPEHAPLFSELWFSNGNPADYPTRLFGRPVELRFLKPVARVRFLFRYPISAVAITHERLSDIAFGPEDPAIEIARKGSVAISYPLQGTAPAYSWIATPDAVDAKSLTAFTEDYQEGVEGKETWYYVLPASAAQQGNYQLTVTVLSKDRVAVVPAEYMSWNPGYEYTYIFKIVDDGTVLFDSVQAVYNPWDLSTRDRNYEVYNW